MSLEANNFHLNYDSSKVSWLKSGGNISKFIKINNNDDLHKLNTIENFDKNKIITIGNFSNFLISDHGYDGVGIKLIGDYAKISIKSDHILCGAGVLDKYFSKFCYLQKITGYEFLYTIPGSIGGNLYMNAGCYGQEIKDKLISIIYFDLDTFEINETEIQNLEFEYRKGFQRKNSIILFGKFELAYSDQNIIKTLMKEYEKKRNISQPQRVNCCGSIFKNPPNQHAWQLIRSSLDESFYSGPIRLSRKHSNFFENDPNISANLIIKFILKIKERVYLKHNVLLEEELQIK